MVVSLWMEDVPPTLPYRANEDAPQDNLSFADWLEHYDYVEPQRGQLLKGLVMSVRRDEIVLDVGLKRDAIVTRRDLERLTPEILARLRPGTEVQAYVLQPYNEDGDLVVSINKALELDDWARAKRLLVSEEIIQTCVLEANKGGLLVTFGRLNGFIPNSHIESIPPTAQEGKARAIKEGLVGMTLDVKVIQVEEERNRLILSERAARRVARADRLAQLRVGQILTGQIVNMTDFGVFVDLGGVDGMIHISNLDHRHIAHPSQILAIGDEVMVRIDGIDLQRERIALNRKAVLPDPWETFIARYQVGDLVEGVVTNVVDYGVFVGAPGGAQGLIHTTRMSKLGAVTPRDMFREGDAILVRVTKLDMARQHIEFSLDDVSAQEEQDWMFRRRQSQSREAIEGLEDAPPAML